MGRKKLIDKLNLTLNDIVNTYVESHDLRDAAKKLKMSTRTLQTYLKEAEYSLKTGPKEGDMHRHYSCVVEFVRKFPTIKLPRSIDSIVDLTKCSKNAVTAYLYRRRRLGKDKLQNLPDLRKTEVILRNTKNQKIPTRLFTSYKAWLDPWNFQLNIKAKVAGKEMQFITTLKGVEKQCTIISPFKKMKTLQFHRKSL